MWVITKCGISIRTKKHGDRSLPAAGALPVDAGSGNLKWEALWGGLVIANDPRQVEIDAREGLMKGQLACGLWQTWP
jgi:hypothetical protein